VILAGTGGGSIATGRHIAARGENSSKVMLSVLRAMGVRAAGHAGRFARDVVGAQTEVTMIFDPFCGVGTVLAVANWLGLDALGVEKNRKRAEGARELAVRSDEV
jgi:hypothetical protein